MEPAQVRPLREGLLRIASIILLCVVGLFAINFAAEQYEELDRRGYVWRTKDVPVLITGNWMVGEYRQCQFITGTPVSQGGSPTPQGLACVSDMTFTDKDKHVLPVKFHGRIERSDKWMDAWRCQRNEKSLECWALD